VCAVPWLLGERATSESGRLRQADGGRSAFECANRWHVHADRSRGGGGVGRLASQVFYATSPVAFLLCLSGRSGCFDAAPSLARAGELSSRVTIATDSQIYRRDQPIHVTVRNNRDAVVYIQATHAPCVVAAIYRRANGQWIREDLCPPATSGPLLRVAPGGALTAALGVTASPEIQGPIVGGPVTPGVSQRDVRTLPVQPPVPPGPIRERTQGILEPGSKPTRPAGGLLPPGTYRLELTAIMGGLSGRKEVIHSGEFVVQ
jgi:hypothetical protein